MSDVNKIPAPYSEGSFEALTPYNSLVDTKMLYTVTALRTIGDIKAANENPYILAYKPAGIEETLANSYMDKLNSIDGVIVTLTDVTGKQIHVPSNYFKSFPIIDGIRYEHLCLYISLGAVNPSLKNQINVLKENVRDLVINATGVQTTKVDIGVVDSRSYVTSAQAELLEIARKNAIKESDNSLKIISDLKEQIAIKDKYIEVLEGKVTKK